MLGMDAFHDSAVYGDFATTCPGRAGVRKVGIGTGEVTPGLGCFFEWEGWGIRHDENPGGKGTQWGRKHAGLGTIDELETGNAPKRPTVLRVHRYIGDSTVDGKVAFWVMWERRADSTLSEIPARPVMVQSKTRIS